MDRNNFLLWLLASIFAYQAIIFGLGTYWCMQKGGMSACPELGQRYDKTFDVMVATTLALLSGKITSGKNE